MYLPIRQSTTTEWDEERQVSPAQRPLTPSNMLKCELDRRPNQTLRNPTHFFEPCMHLSRTCHYDRPLKYYLSRSSILTCSARLRHRQLHPSVVRTKTKTAYAGLVLYSCLPACLPACEHPTIFSPLGPTSALRVATFT
jgi:hypothetical protein